MKKNLFIFTVLIMSAVGVCGTSHAEIASVDYVSQQLKTKLDAEQGPGNQNKALVIGPAGEVIPGKITADYLDETITAKIDGALTDITAENVGTVITDKVITVAKLTDVADNANKVLTIGADGAVSAQLPSIPVGQEGTGGAAQIWIEQ